MLISYIFKKIIYGFFYCILFHLSVKQKLRQTWQKAWLGDLFHLIDSSTSTACDIIL